MTIDMNTQICNSINSFTASDIKKWCEYQVNNDTKFSFEAKEMLEEIWVKSVRLFNQTAQNDVYYFVRLDGITPSEGAPGFIAAVWLESDDKKSPDAVVKFT
ncbi:hypothetical protein [Bacillus cereus]|uniref:hypothetical protein n=1 Tax=Bacillus cereus TaxID=1396 RepID=UPI000B4B71FD|nr:hypothetical protein [Bacillus cereus]